MFSTLYGTYFSKFKMSSAISFNLDQSKILSSGNGLKQNAVGKGEIAPNEPISPFITVFTKDLYCRHVKARVHLGKGQRWPFRSWDENFTKILKNHANTPKAF